MEVGFSVQDPPQWLEKSHSQQNAGVAIRTI